MITLISCWSKIRFNGFDRCAKAEIKNKIIPENRRAFLMLIVKCAAGTSFSFCLQVFQQVPFLTSIRGNRAQNLPGDGGHAR